MEITPSHWRKMWEEGFIPWHHQQVSKSLQNHMGPFTGDRPSVSILVPFCGKSVDMHWLWQQGHTVVGVEISELAAKQFFEENGIPYQSSAEGDFTIFSGTDNRLNIFAGNMYNMTPSKAGSFDAIWDDKALVAVNTEDRSKYVATLLSLLKPDGRILMSTYEYNQEEHSGQPFPIPSDMLRSLFPSMKAELLETTDLTGSQLTQECKLSHATELIHLLIPH